VVQKLFIGRTQHGDFISIASLVFKENTLNMHKNKTQFSNYYVTANGFDSEDHFIMIQPKRDVIQYCQCPLVFLTKQNTAGIGKQKKTEHQNHVQYC
jgi:hypothetical protein